MISGVVCRDTVHNYSPSFALDFASSIYKVDIVTYVLRIHYTL